MTSAILTELSKTYPEVLTNPESVLGPNYLKVLKFWKHIEGLSEQEKEEIFERYYALDVIVRESAIVSARDAAVEVVGCGFRLAGFSAARDVTGWVVFGWATLELVGNVDNKVVYDLIMSHKQP